MNAMDLMRAMNGVGDDILMESEEQASARRSLLSRVVAVAAVIALLCGTVYAAFGDVTLHLDDENTSYFFNDFEFEGISYSKVTFEYQLSAVEVEENAVAFLEDMIAPCDHWLLDENRLIPTMNYHTHQFAKLEMAETFFGLQFQLPTVIREGKIGTRQVEMDAKPMYYPDDATRHEGYGFSYEPTLGGASLFFNTLPEDEAISSISTFIYLAITEEFAQVPYCADFLYAMDAYGEPKILEARIGDEEFTILTFPDCPESHADVFYVRDGIGYKLSFCPAEGYSGNLEKTVSKYLKTLG